MLVFAFELQNIASEITMHLAIGTSLATILVTGSSSTLGHFRRGSIHREWLIALLPGLVLGSIAGVFVADNLSGTLLENHVWPLYFIDCHKNVVWFSAQARQCCARQGAMALAGGVIGMISALFGIGGGAMTVPLLSRCGASMTQAVGTAAAVGLPIALVGALTFIVVGWGNSLLPAWATGFVMWPAFSVSLSPAFPLRV
ncbi:hypothetical protein HSBAA_20620 [Vreelandella sulfidaeris]|uniref:Probable membrane transporter protein n=1 Tax=Vreelandella sulfidaeris TaxID=115553 RepID=A0A455U3Z8_9GAMM|nr:hypothetical protein HSBAA_20620 [Halomonas sulfidaeris]